MHKGRKQEHLSSVSDTWMKNAYKEDHFSLMLSGFIVCVLRLFNSENVDIQLQFFILVPAKYLKFS